MGSRCFGLQSARAGCSGKSRGKLASTRGGVTAGRGKCGQGEPEGGGGERRAVKESGGRTEWGGGPHGACRRGAPLGRRAPGGEAGTVPGTMREDRRLGGWRPGQPLGWGLGKAEGRAAAARNACQAPGSWEGGCPPHAPYGRSCPGAKAREGAPAPPRGNRPPTQAWQRAGRREPGPNLQGGEGGENYPTRIQLQQITIIIIIINSHNHNEAGALGPRWEPPRPRHTKARAGVRAALCKSSHCKRKRR